VQFQVIARLSITPILLITTLVLQRLEQTKHHAYYIDYYSSFAKNIALDVSGNPINNLKEIKN
jgi:hypothetical protein